MSVIPPLLGQGLQFYLSSPLPCPYLPTQVERKLFTRLHDGSGVANAELNAEINSALCRAGFRRSHDVVYRPACQNCAACVPVRIPVKVFEPSRTQRRLAARSAALGWHCVPAVPSDELYRLFCAYQSARHGDSDMAHMSELEFAAMLREGQADTHLYTLRNAYGKLLGCAIADHVGDGISAVYSFFDPQEAKRSLGTVLILRLVEEARKRDWPFVYLGYWIAQSRKMSYKASFRPLQFLSPHGWEWMEQD